MEAVLLERLARLACRLRDNPLRARSFHRAPISKNAFALLRRRPRFPAPPLPGQGRRHAHRRHLSQGSPFIAAPSVPDNASLLRVRRRIVASLRVPVCRRSVPADRAPCIRFRAPA
jgi:hypothetical protein